MLKGAYKNNFYIHVEETLTWQLFFSKIKYLFKEFQYYPLICLTMVLITKKRERETGVFYFKIFYFIFHLNNLKINSEAFNY